MAYKYISMHVLTESRITLRMFILQMSNFKTGFDYPRLKSDHCFNTALNQKCCRESGKISNLKPFAKEYDALWL